MTDNITSSMIHPLPTNIKEGHYAAKRRMKPLGEDVSIKLGLRRDEDMPSVRERMRGFLVESKEVLRARCAIVLGLSLSDACSLSLVGC